MGSRSVDPEGERALAAKQVGKLGESFPDRFCNEIHCHRMGFKPVVPHGNDGIKAGRRSADHPFRTMIKASTRTFVRKLDRVELFLVARWTMAMRLEKAKRAFQACNSRREFASRDWRFGGRFDGENLEHAAQLRAPRSTNREGRHAPC